MFWGRVSEVLWQQKVTISEMGFALLFSSKALIPIQ